MNQPTFSLLYTSARQVQIPKVIDLWESRADKPFQVEHCIVTDGGIFHGEWDGTLDWSKLPRNRFKFDAVKNPPHNCTRGWNLAAKMSTGKIIVLVSDDIVPPEHWDTSILEALGNHYKFVDFTFDDAPSATQFSIFKMHWVLHVDDGTEDKKLTHAIMSRAYYEKLGYFFHPLFESMYNDTALWEVAQRDNVIIDARHLLFDHEHFYFWKREQDDVDRQHSSNTRYETGRRVFDWLKSRNFPPPSNQVPKSKADYVAYMQVNKDDFFLLEICTRLMEEGVTKFFFHVPVYSWAGVELSKEDEQAIVHVVSELKNAGAQVTYWPHIKPPKAGQQRIARETEVRNAALAQMREMGNPFVLIVDGDELWKRGTLDKVHLLASEGAQAIASNMIDVAGLPAYPIDSHDHTALIYIGPDSDFCYCRCPYAPAVHIEGRNIYHFSAVRRTKEELIAKMKGSGHYGEDGYDFEGFIKNKLPNIKPNARNVHIFRDGSRWPVVRDWDSSDWPHIPEPIKLFLKQ